MSIKPKIGKNIDQVGNDSPPPGETSWLLTGNTLAGGEVLGSTSGGNWGLIHDGTQVITLKDYGPLLTGTIQPNTGSFRYVTGNGRMLVCADNGSTSGGAFLSIFGTTGGTILGAPYLDNSVTLGQYFGGGAVQTFVVSGVNGNLLLGNSTGVLPTARLDVRTTGSSGATSAFRIENSSTTEVFKVSETGNVNIIGNITLTDRTTSDKYNLYIDNGVLSIELI